MTTETKTSQERPLAELSGARCPFTAEHGTAPATRTDATAADEGDYGEGGDGESDYHQLTPKPETVNGSNAAA